MLRIGLTGGIGAGKSTVAARLAELGAVVVDADELAREVVAPGSEGLRRVAESFGANVIAEDGALDRAVLAQTVFADPDARARLEAITHPLIADRAARRFAEAEREHGPATVAVHDVPLLVEKHLGAGYHLVLVVDAAVPLRLERLIAGRAMTPGQARSRIAAQADEAERRAAADVWLDNSGPPGDLVAAVDTLWSTRLVPYAAGLAAGRPAAGRAADPDGAARRRLLARVRRALGARPAEVTWKDGTPEVVVRLRPGPDAAPLEDTAEAVARAAGFAPVPAGGTGRPTTDAGQRRYLSCDPGLAGTVLSVAALTV